MSDLADVRGDRDVDGDQRNTRRGDEPGRSLAGCGIDRNHRHQLDALGDEVLHLGGLHGEVAVRIPEVEVDLVAALFLHAGLDVLIELEAAAVGGGADR